VVIRPLDRLDALHKHLLVQPNIEEVRVVDDALEVEVASDEVGCCRLLSELCAEGFLIVEFRPRRADLEQIFMTVTKGDVQCIAVSCQLSALSQKRR
jgi:hypothetical protein